MLHPIVQVENKGIKQYWHSCLSDTSPQLPFAPLAKADPCSPRAQAVFHPFVLSVSHQGGCREALGFQQGCLNFTAATGPQHLLGWRNLVPVPSLFPGTSSPIPASPSNTLVAACSNFLSQQRELGRFGLPQGTVLRSAEAKGSGKIILSEDSDHWVKTEDSHPLRPLGGLNRINMKNLKRLFKQICCN